MSLRRPPSLHQFRELPDGYIFQVITEGFGLMPSLRDGAVGAGSLGGGRLPAGPPAQPARHPRPGPPGRARAARPGAPMTLTPYQGGQKLLRLSAAAGAAGLAVTALGGLVFDPRRALHAYLVAFVYWLGIALGALILLGAFHASNARWPVVLRRFLEHVTQVIPLFVLLFVPIALGRAHLFPWVNPHAAPADMAPRHRAQGPLAERPLLPGAGRLLLRLLDRGGPLPARLVGPAGLGRRGDAHALAAAARGGLAPAPRAHAHLRGLRLDDVARPALLLDHLRRLLVRRQLHGGLRGDHPGRRPPRAPTRPSSART